MTTTVGSTDERQGWYCERCGQFMPMSTGDGGSAFHLCSTLYSDPMAPFCSKCGRTVRTGFLPNRTCQCDARRA